MQAKKSFGQHFLHREDIAERIAGSLLKAGAVDGVLEIGPGKGFLTKYLVQLPAVSRQPSAIGNQVPAIDRRLLVVEADKDMVSYMQTHFPDLKGSIIAADFLHLKLDTLFKGQFCIIGNFPYNISSQILIKMIEYKEWIPELVGMFQKEVAERVVAPPGSKTYGVIGILCQAFYDCEYLFTVDKSSFNPPPKVQSAVIRLTRTEDQDLGCDPKLFRTVVKQAFSQRRKMLRNTMKQMLKDHPVLETEFFMLRPEQLSLKDYVELTNKVAEHNGRL